MILRAAAGVIAGAIIVVLACFMLVPYARAAEVCAGQLVRASWYGAESGARTASGRAFDGRQWLVAHRTCRSARSCGSAIAASP